MWQNIYRDANVLVRTDGNGNVGVWHGQQGDWTLSHTTSQGLTYKGYGPTMHKARADMQSRKP